METKENLHEGHRERVRQKIKDIGFENLPEHEQLEYFLFNVIARANTNELAHLLINSFGGLNEVFNAPIESLTKVKGVGLKTARFLKDIPLISNAYVKIKAKGIKTIKSPADIISTYKPLMQAKEKEEIFVVCLDCLGRVLNASTLSKGSTDAVDYNPHSLITLVSSCSASNVVIMHNHPFGEAQPSAEDIASTKKIYYALNSISVCLLDHYIFNSVGEVYSFLDGKWFDAFDENFRKTAPFFPTQTKMSHFKRIDKIMQ